MVGPQLVGLFKRGDRPGGITLLQPGVPEIKRHFEVLGIELLRPLEKLDGLGPLLVNGMQPAQIVQALT